MTRNGWGPHVVRQLYAGLGSAAAFSVVVGAIHWLTFCTAKRAALDYMVANEAKQQQGGAAAGGVAAAAAAAVVAAEEKRAKKGKGSHQGPVHVSASGSARVHVSSGHHLHDEEVVLAEGGLRPRGDCTCSAVCPDVPHTFESATARSMLPQLLGIGYSARKR